MNSFSPILRNLKHLESLMQKSVSLGEQWEIMEAYDRDIVWNVVMAFLNYFPREEEEDFENRLRKLGIIGEDEKLSKEHNELVGCIKRYNPFLKRNAYFCEKIMDSVIKPFKIAIRNFNPLYADGDVNFNSNLCLYCCASLLSCDILLVAKTADGKIESEHSTLFMSGSDSIQTTDNKVLIVFSEILDANFNKPSNQAEDSNGIFSFGIHKEYGKIKQRIALKEILKDVKFSETENNADIVKKILWLENVQENFLTSLLKSDLARYVPIIYKSPYVLTKLRDAGFQTNPTVANGEHYNGFYYTLSKENTSLLYFLYDYAANTGLEIDNSIRAPNEFVIDNLKKLRTHLESLVQCIEIESNNEEYLQKLRDVLRLNSFQIDVCSKIDEINGKHKPDAGEESELESISEGSDSESEHGADHEKDLLSDEEDCKDSNLTINAIKIQKIRQVTEATLRKEIILSILHTYQKYFYWEKRPGNENELLNMFDEFSKHTDYFENLDFCSAVMFFDRIFLLKDRLKLPSELYTNIETKFFFFIYSKKHVVKCSKNWNLPSEELSKLTSVQVRLSLEKGIFNFNKVLQEVTVAEDNVLKCLPGDLAHTLISLPLVYDEFLITRLKKYLDLSTKNTMKSEKSIFIVQRTLQVIGECLTSTKPGFKSIKKILPLLLPHKLKQNLLKIRNKLSHIRSTEIEHRNSAIDVELFKGIQTELKSIKEILIPVVLMAQSYTINRFVLDFIYSVVEKTEKNVSSDKDDMKLWREKFERIRLSLKDQISVVNKENQEAMKKKNFRSSVSNLFESVEKSISNKELTKTETLDGLKLITYDLFWCIEFVLQYLAMDERFKNSQTKLNEKSERYLKLFSELHQENRQQNYSDEIDVNGILFYRNVFLENNTSNGISNDNKKTELNANENLTNQSEEIKKHFLEECSILLKEYKTVADEMIGSEPDIEVSFENIAKLRDRLDGKPFLTPNETKILNKCKVSHSYKHIDFVKNKILTHLKGSSYLSIEELKLEITDLQLDEKKQDTFFKNYNNNDFKKCLKIVSSIPDYTKELQAAIDTCEIDKKKYDSIWSTPEIPSEVQAILKKLVKGQKRFQSGNTVEFLWKRVSKMKDILIDENKDIRLLWERAKHPKTKAYLKERLTELYLTDPEVQAAVEMLLVDCMSVLDPKKFSHLWKKTMNLFSGINLRNVLAHGNPLMETVGKLVDPFDLPSELVQNMMRLISDEKALKSMVELVDLLKSDYDFLIRVMDKESDSVAKEIQSLRTEIGKSENWKEYAQLLKHKSK